MVRFSPWTFLLSLAVATAAHAAGVVTDSVTASTNVSNPANAVGLPATGDFGSDVTPFTPPFSAANMAIVGNATPATPNTAAASLTLHFAQPVITGPGAEIGVYTGVGLVADFDPDTSVISAAPGPAFFSSMQEKAIVSVSSDNLTYIPLNGGSPMDLAGVGYAYTNSQLTFHTDFFYVDAVNGSSPTDPFKPYTGALADFGGKTNAQMLSMLNGSYGGKWIDASSSGLAQFSYVRFEIPQGATYRLLLDTVTANSAPVPEPASLGLLGIGITMLALRRRRDV